LTALGFALAALIGLSLGLLGAGGSILTVPIFVYVLGFEAKAAIAMSLAVVGATALFGALGHWRGGNVNLRVSLLFGSVAMVGTFLGARLALFVPGRVQLLLFACVMLSAAYFMLRPVAPEPGLPAKRRSAGWLVVDGLVVGVLTGLVGVGGGFLIVPALVLLARVPMKQAIGTSLLVIAFKSATGFLGYLDQVEVPWLFLGAFTSISVLGIIVGTRLSRHVPAASLRRAFGYFLIVMGALILYENVDALF
jgi:uncharacterized protein